MEAVAEHISMTEASARGIARMAREASQGHPVAIARHKRPVAVILGYDDYRQLLERAQAARLRPRIPTPFQG